MGGVCEAATGTRRFCFPGGCWAPGTAFVTPVQTPRSAGSARVGMLDGGRAPGGAKERATPVTEEASEGVGILCGYFAPGAGNILYDR